MQSGLTPGKGLFRRNSSLFIKDRSGQLSVVKSYHNKYSIQDELACYEFLPPLVDSIPSLELPLLYDVDVAKGELHIEFVDGATLQSMLIHSGVGSFKPNWLQVVVSLCAGSFHKNFALDADPSNFIYDESARRLVFIDPVMEVEGVEHVSISVFLWGLVKYRVRFFYRFPEYPCFASFWHQVMRRYCDLLGCTPASVYNSLACYVDNVIRWNLRESRAESIFKRLFRLIMVVPLWWCSGRLFRILRDRLRAAEKR